MARKKKKKSSEFFSWTPQLSPEVIQEIVAIVLIALAGLLLLGIFGIGGTFPNAMLQGLRLSFGLAAFILPAIFALLAWVLFQPDRFELRAHNYIGLGFFLTSLSGLLHLTAPTVTALESAGKGLGGGFVGYGISAGLLMILDRVAVVVVLVAVLCISLVVAANTKLSRLIGGLKGIFSKGPREDLTINEPSGMVMSNKLPIRGTIGGRGKGLEKAEEALTVMQDADWTAPSLDLLQATSSKPNAGNIKENAGIIQNTLESFGIEAHMGEVNVGPTVTQYTLKPESGVKLSKITALDHNLSLALAASAVRIEAPIPGKGAVGVEVPNKTAATVALKDILNSPEMKENKSPLAIVLGRDVSGEPAIADLSEMPHLLIAGATGTGKSVMINSLLTTLLYRNSPSQLKLILVDPKRVELTPFNDVPHLLAPVITEDDKTVSALKWGVAEMQRRYKLFTEQGKRNIAEYNAAMKEEGMPYIVLVIDEMAQLMGTAGRDAEALIVQLAQLARATGIHLVLATQRPSVDVITGLIKANIPARIAFTVASQVDSRTILDGAGAEKLLGKGDMLFSSPKFLKPKRIQGALISIKEVNAVNDYLRAQRPVSYNDEVLNQKVNLSGGRGGMDSFGEADDDLFQEAADTVIRSGKASASLLQRRLRVGYARAARLLDLLEERGIVGPGDGARPRDVLVSSVNDVSAGSDIGPDENVYEE